MRNRPLFKFFLLAALVLCALPWTNTGNGPVTAAEAPTGAEPISKEAIEALKSLKDLTKSSDADARKKVYDLLAEKGDVRLIPVIKAYKDGLLLLRDDRFVTIGPRITMSVDGQQTSVAPLVDILSGEMLKGPDGKPIYIQRMSGAIAASYKENKALSELLSGLSLLDPDPKVRLSSIRDVSERAARAFIDVSEQQRFVEALRQTAAAFKSDPVPEQMAPLVSAATAAVNAALAEKPGKPIQAIPGKSAAEKAIGAVKKVQEALEASTDATSKPAASIVPPASGTMHLLQVLNDFSNVARDYGDRLDWQEKVLLELPNYAGALRRQYDKDPKSRYSAALQEALAGTDAALGDHAAQMKSVAVLGQAGTSRAANILQRLYDSARQAGDADLANAAAPALAKAARRQGVVHFVQNTFFGLSSGSILVLLALGLSIIFGLMGVINMAHGEFMMIGAFTTYLVSEGFKLLPAGFYNYYLIAAIPAAFLVAGLFGFLCEYLVIRHLYGRPLETLLATFGVGLVIIWAVRKMFGDSVSVKPPAWMEGDLEVVPDLNLQLDRIYIIIYCGICIAVVYFILNRTKLGLLLRATTQNRDMAAALGVATRRIDGITFAIGAGLAGLAGVAVPLYNKINPQMGQEYIVDSFMVVVVGGVGKLAGAIWAGLGLGFISKYLEPIFQNIKMLASGASVFGRVLVLAMIVIFLQFRPSGLFPPKGRNADA